MTIIKALKLPILLVLFSFLAYKLSYFPFVSTENPLPSDSKFQVENVKNKVRDMTLKPHPVGSIEIERVRNYLVDELEKLGLEVSLQRAEMLNGNTLVNLTNVIAKLKGKNESGKSLLLMSHYDSVPNSPGANDAAYGVALLIETMRVMSQQELPENDIILLITDAEETGLLGAEAFIEQHPLADSVGMVLNFDARGSKGPLLMFETSDNNKALIQKLSNYTGFPVADSFYSRVFELMPNDTDFTIIKSQDVSGMNFAYIDGKYYYHTINDSIENISDETLAHAATLALPLASHFANTDLSSSSTTDAIYFNITANIFIHYSQFTGYIILILGIGLFVLYLRYYFTKEALTYKELLLGTAVIFFQWLLSFTLVTFTILALKKITDFGFYEQGASGHIFLLGLVLFSFTLQYLWALIPSKRITPGVVIITLIISVLLTLPLGLELLYSAVISIVLTSVFLMVYRLPINKQFLQQYNVSAWFIIAIVASVLDPFIAHIFLIPVLALLLVELANKYFLKSNWFVSIFAAAVAWLMWTAHIYHFFVGVSDIAPGVIALFSCMLLGLTVPQITAYANSMGSKGLVVFSFITLSVLVFPTVVSPYSEKHPQPYTLNYFIDQNVKSASWISSDKEVTNWNGQLLLSNELMQIENPLDKSSTKLFWSNPTKLVSSPDHQLRLLKDNTSSSSRELKWHFMPAEKIEKLYIQFDDAQAIKEIYLNGQKPSFYKGKNSWTTVAFFGVPEEGVTIRLEKDSNLPVELLILTVNNSYPDEIKKFVPERNPEFMPKPYKITDSTVVRKSYVF